VIPSDNSKLDTMRLPTPKVGNATPARCISTPLDKDSVASDIPVIGSSEVLGNLRKPFEE
jgi:hypothetical protein